ncbi:MAG: amidohydrolase family protein [Candidatus Rokubacteria bacterium]|nr:amidohydrolase family protein [Candidatus Rokubacteria bacterium]
MGSSRALAAVVVLLLAAAPLEAADYAGPLIDAHAHLPNGTAIDGYVEAMKRHNVTKVVLLGVGGVQKEDPAWIAAARRKHPDRVVAGLPLPDPTGAGAAERLDAALARDGARVIGEVHVRQVSRKIERDLADAALAPVLELSAKRGVPIVIHQELDDRAAAGLEAALAAHRNAIIVLAHAGSATPARLEGLLKRNPNLRVDLSGMHFQRTPRLASEDGPLDPAFKALIVKHADRFLMGIDVWAARLFEPAMLDRLMRWTRRLLGELPPDVAERVAWKNAAGLFRLE